MNSKGKKIALLLLAGLLMVILYIIIHETGHMLVMLLYGDTISDFSILRAHVSGYGGEYTPYGRMWMNANGAFLPYLVALLYLAFYKKDNHNTFYQLFTYEFLIAICGSLVPWLLFPFLYLGGNSPVGDDVTKFLDVFSTYCSPIVLSCVVAVLMAVLIWFIVRKSVARTVISIINGKEPDERTQKREKNNEK